MMSRRMLMMMSLVATTASGAAFAHHGWGSYDAARKFSIDSTVEQLRWQNPHVQIGVKHQGATWELVLAPPFRMDARGLKPEMIKVGARVAVEGYPSTRAANEMRAERIMVGGQSYELR